MARPRKEDAGKARQAIIDTFWALLEKVPYSDLSIRLLATQAGVNHNTFYRHFDNIDDLARKAFKDIVPAEIPSLLHSALLQPPSEMGALNKQSDFWEYTRKARLYILSDSLYLNRIIEDSFKELWLDYLQVSEADLTPEETLELSFLMGGFIAAVRTNSNTIDSMFIAGLLEVPLFRAALDTLTKLGKRE